MWPFGGREKSDAVLDDARRQMEVMGYKLDATAAGYAETRGNSPEQASCEAAVYCHAILMSVLQGGRINARSKRIGVLLEGDALAKLAAVPEINRARFFEGRMNGYRPTLTKSALSAYGVEGIISGATIEFVRHVSGQREPLTPEIAELIKTAVETRNRWRHYWFQQGR